MLNVKAVVADFNQGEALLGAFSMIAKTDCETDGSSAALVLSPGVILAPSSADLLQSVNISHLGNTNTTTTTGSSYKLRLMYPQQRIPKLH